MLYKEEQRRQTKRGKDEKTKQCGEVIEQLKKDRSWPRVIDTLDKEHRDWPEVQAYRRAKRTPGAYTKLLNWVRTTHRRYCDWKKST